MHRKFLVSLLLICCFIPFVFGYTYVTAAGYDFSNYVAGARQIVKIEHPAPGAGNSAVAQTFNVSEAGYLSGLTVMAAVVSTDGVRVGSGPNMELKAWIYGCADSLSGNPNTTVYAESTNVLNTTVETDLWSNSADWDGMFTFKFDGTFYMNVGEVYDWVVFADTVTSADGDNYTAVYYDSSASSDEGYSNLYTAGAWFGATSANDFLYDVTVNRVDTSPVSYGDTDDTISSLMWWFIYLIVMLAPAWFLGVYCKMGKWGFIAGIAVGAGVGYAFLTGFPLWLLIVVVIAEVGLAYQSLSSGG